VLAIGGVTVERARAVPAAGAAGVAAISLFSEARDIAGTVRALRDALTLPSRHD
jgi:thiamine monophosphate synthase